MPTAFTVEGASVAIGQIASPSVHVGSTRMGGVLLNTVETTVTNVVSLRPPQYGITLAQRRLILQSLLPIGVSRWVQLFSVMPDRAGLGYAEADFDRVEVTNWRNVTIAGYIARRVNVGEVRFASGAGGVVAVGCGVFEESTGDNLLMAGLLRGPDLTARTFTFEAGEEPVFGDGLLRFGIQ